MRKHIVPVRYSGAFSHEKWTMVVYVFILMISLIAGQPAAAQNSISFTASVDNAKVSTDDYITLELTLSGPFRNADNPEFPQLEDFYVLSSGQSSQFSLVNGQMSSKIVYSYRLQPLREGNLTIPAIEIKVGKDSYKTESLTVEVIAGSAPEAQPESLSDQDKPLPDAPAQLDDQNFFVEAEVDNDTPFVSEQVIYTFRLYQRINFSRQPGLDWPEFTGFLAYDLSPNQQYHQTVGENQYLVTEVRRILFPTATGKINLDPTLLTVPGDFFNEGFLLQTNYVFIDVLPLPENAPDTFNGAVGQFKIHAWVEPELAKVNEPISLFVRMEGIGNVNTLPDPTEDTLPSAIGWRVYDPQVSTNTQQVGEALQGEKVIERLLLPTKPGLLEIPIFSLSYFNPDSGTYQQVSTELISVEVAEGDVEEPSVVIIGEDQQEIQILGADIRHIKSAPPILEMASRSLVSQTSYWIAWVIPFFVVTSIFIWYQRRQNLERDSIYMRRQRALYMARRRFSELPKISTEDAVYAGVAQTITQYIGDKLNISSTGLTRDAIKEKLASRVSTNAIVRLLNCLDWADSGRFAPAAEGRDINDLIEQAIEIVESMDQVL